MGAYHSGVEVSGVEWTFAQNGIFFHTPKTPKMAPGQVVKLRESMEMGTHVGSANDVHGVINRCGVCGRVSCPSFVITMDGIFHRPELKTANQSFYTTGSARSLRPTRITPSGKTVITSVTHSVGSWSGRRSRRGSTAPRTLGGSFPSAAVAVRERMGSRCSRRRGMPRRTRQRGKKRR